MTKKKVRKGHFLEAPTPLVEARTDPSSLVEAHTTDYCLLCGESPESGAHMLGRCSYQHPRLSAQDAEHAKQSAEKYYKAPKELLADSWLPHIFADEDFRAAIEACDKILKVKGADYTMKLPDRLANFREAAGFLGQSKYQVLGVYLFKHLTAVFSFLKHGQVESEPIEGRIYDCVNYMLLLFKMVSEDKRRKAHEQSGDQSVAEDSSGSAR